MTTRRAEAIIDTNALAANIALLKARAGTDLLAVVKADAYGHGLIRTAEAALKAGAEWLGVALLEEAIALRTHGISAPVIAWLVPPGSDFESAIRHEIDLGVSSQLAFDQIVAAGKKVGVKPRIHIEVDSGMTRGGFLDEWKNFLHSDFSGVEVIGFFSHFARADEPGQAQNRHQRERFLQMREEFCSAVTTPILTHLSNSAATLVDEYSRFDLVRTGIAMYGLHPDASTLRDEALSPVMQLRAKLHLVKKVPAGSPVGYGASAVTERETTLGVVAMGYADGIPRNTQGAGIFFAGNRAPIIGRVSMDQFVVDLGSDSTAQSGDWAIVFGSGKAGEYTADEWAAAAGTINYEIVTRIGPRVPRIYGNHVY